MHRLVLLLLLATVVARAHEPGLSTAEFRATRDGVELVLTFAIADMDNLLGIDNDGDGKISQIEFDYSKARIASMATQAVNVTIDEQVVTGETSARMDAQDNIEFRVRYPKSITSNFVYRCAVLSQLPRAHRQFATLKDASGKVMAERLLNAQNDSLVFPPDIASRPAEKKTFAGFVSLGIEHILTGYDHLLFLFGLLLVTRHFGSAIKVITCFTIAHSITLAVATFNLFNVPSKIVEPLIAATIVYVGIENIILHGEPKGRWMLTFGFGLIHGFGFASVLRDLGVASAAGGVAMPLFSFNLGVEVGQIAVATVLLPLIWRFSKNPQFPQRWVPACSVLVALLGAYWFIERVWGK